MNTQKQIFLIVALFFVFTGGCAAYTLIDLPVRARDQADWHHSQSVERGALLFANNCRTCHGIQGEGGVGPQLNKADFQNQDPLVLKNTRALLKRTLTCGRAGTLMPAWLNTNGGSLNERQIDHLVDFLTTPVEGKYKDEAGNATSEGWHFALEFAHNLNRETALAIGGDTLGTIAAAHEVGVDILVKANSGYGPDDVLPKGTKVAIPDTTIYEARKYTVRKDRETLRKIADTEAVGAMAVADANGIKYTFNPKTTTLSLVPGGNDDLYGTHGLFVGKPIKLPAGSRYALKTGDTFDTIAEVHGVAAADLEKLNPNIEKTADGNALLAEHKLKLPDNAVVVVQAGQTVAAIASAHGIKVEDLQAANNLTAETVVGAGQRLKLPAGTRYTVQAGDSLASVAEGHAMSVNDLANLNGLKPNDPISPQIILNLPAIENYTVQGQTLHAVAQTLSGVTEDDMGKANDVPANAILQVGQPLVMPATAWGSAPPDAKNPGTACIEYAVPNSVFASLPGVGTATAATGPTKPAEASKAVSISGGANDWTLTADGKASDKNKGVALVAKGSKVEFTVIEGLHTITLNGKKDGADVKKGDTRTITFADAGTFKITCDFHPDMLAYLFVE